MYYASIYARVGIIRLEKTLTGGGVCAAAVAAYCWARVVCHLKIFGVLLIITVMVFIGLSFAALPLLSWL
jgi:hypothetical protein